MHCANVQTFNAHETVNEFHHIYSTIKVKNAVNCLQIVSRFKFSTK